MLKEEKGLIYIYYVTIDFQDDASPPPLSKVGIDNYVKCSITKSLLFLLVGQWHDKICFYYACGPMVVGRWSANGFKIAAQCGMVLAGLPMSTPKLTVILASYH